MFAKETLKKIADVLKLEVSDFEAKFKSDKEETLEVPVLYTEDDKNTFGTNRFNEGKKAATEIAVKDLKAKFNFDFEDKSMDTFLEKYSEKVIADAKITPDEQVKKLKDEKKQLQDQVGILKSENEKSTKDFNTRLFQVETQTEVFKHIPKNTIIPAEDIALLFMNSHRVAKEDNRVVIYKGDNVLKDNVLNPLPLKDVIASFSEPYINKNGMGGGDTGGGGAATKYNTMSELYADLRKKGIEPLGPDGLKAVAEAKKNNPAFKESE